MDMSTLLLPETVSEKLIYMSKNSDLSLYLFLLTNLKIVLYKYNNISNFAVGSPIYNTQNHKTFSNKFVALVDKLEEGDSFKDYLLKIRETTINAYDNQEYSLNDIIRELIDSEIIKEQNLFKVVCLLANIHDKAIIDNYKNDLIVKFTRNEKNIELNILYNKDLFSNETIELFINRYIYVLEQTINNPSENIENISILSQEEKEKILKYF
ncbi:MAG TPA: hypothetical protein DCM59_11830, partial [Clostridium sp.]|nr:hypothetical protein [Clostridium sp.]